jgi:hypothetical protein
MSLLETGEVEIKRQLVSALATIPKRKRIVKRLVWVASELQKPKKIEIHFLTLNVLSIACIHRGLFNHTSSGQI